MITIAAAFDCDTAIVGAFHNKVDSLCANQNLRIDAVATFDKQVVHLSLER